MFVWSGSFFTQGIFSEMRCYIYIIIVPQSAVYSSLLALQPYYEYVQGAKIANLFYVPTLPGILSNKLLFRNRFYNQILQVNI